MGIENYYLGNARDEKESKKTNTETLDRGLCSRVDEE